MEQHWGWLIVIYLFLGGLGAGAYLTSFAASKGYLGNAPALRPLKILKVIIFHKITNLVLLYNSNPHEIHV